MILITGSNGQLGSEFCKTLDNSRGLSRSELDISDFKKTKDILKELRPEVIINCAAWTAVDKAEDQKQDCFLINHEAVVNLTKICKEIDCYFIQISSDYVFGSDLLRNSPYKENEKTGPISVYGHSKVKSEESASAWEKSLIIRTCGLFSSEKNGPVRGRNFLDTMLLISKEKSELSVVDDQFCTPSYVPHVAQGIAELIKNRCTGIFNVTNSGLANWFDFACELFNQSKINIKIKPIKSEQYICKAKRPKYSVLSQEKFNKIYQLPSWQDGIRDYLSKYSRTGKIS